MSHTLVSNPLANVGALLPVQVTIVDYALGGEAITLSELRVTTISGVILGSVPPGQNSLAVPLFPILEAGKVKLYRFVSGAPAEIPATVGLNAVVTALVVVLAQ